MPFEDTDLERMELRVVRATFVFLFLKAYTDIHAHIHAHARTHTHTHTDKGGRLLEDEETVGGLHTRPGEEVLQVERNKTPH